MEHLKGRILCADQDPVGRQLVKETLDRAGYEVTTAAAISESFRAASAQLFDLYVIADLLSDGAGAELGQLIRGVDADAPILILSGESREIAHQQVADAGAQAFLTKPWEPWKLAQIVWVLLKVAAEGQENE
jgi:DNA-binding response OmpR family regulator